MSPWNVAFITGTWKLSSRLAMSNTAVFMPMDSQKTLRLYEVAPNALAVSGGMWDKGD